ncbi:MAG: Ig-like domain-containing protein [Gemmataceae bacterium]
MAGGGVDEAGQTLTVVFLAAPSATLSVVLADGVTVVTTGTPYTVEQLRGLQFRTTANANGSAELRLVVRDDGTTTGAADPQAITEAWTVTVTPVNDTPVRTAGATATLVVPPDSGEGPLGLGGLNYSPGGGTDEAAQALTFRITAIPAFSLGTVRLADGGVVQAGATCSVEQLRGLRFQPAAGASGSGQLTFTVTDNGQPAPETLTQTLTIAVIPAADPEPNDTLETAIAANGPMQGVLGNTLDPAQDVDWYAFPVTAGQVLSVGVSYPLGLRLYDPSGTDITAQLGYLPRLFARSTGTYYARVSGSGSWTGTYTFSYTTQTLEVDETEDNDSIATADLVAAAPGTPVSVRGYLGNGAGPGDHDFYAVTLLAGQQLEIAYAGEVVSWYGRTYVRDAAGNVLTQKTELSNRPLVYSSFEDQTVYVDFTDGLLYSYTLTFTVSPLDPQYLDAEPNDTLETALPVSDGQAQEPSATARHALQDVDWYSFSVTAGQVLSVSVSYPLGLRLYDPSGVDITAQLGYLPRLVARSTGTYYAGQRQRFVDRDLHLQLHHADAGGGRDRGQRQHRHRRPGGSRARAPPSACRLRGQRRLALATMISMPCRCWRGQQLEILYAGEVVSMVRPHLRPRRRRQRAHSEDRAE